MRLIRLVGISLSLLFSLSTVPLVASAASSVSSFVQLTGSTAGDNTGRSMATGDINGDGYDDLVVGSHFSAETAAGKVYLIYGQSSPLTSTTLSSSNIIFTGASIGDRAGTAVAIGDLNADGYDDIVMGASKDDGSATNAGAIYIAYGQAATLTSQTLSASVGAKFTGEAAGDLAGTAVVVTDLNGDTYADILVGSPKNNDGGGDAGAVYMIPGSATQYTGITGALGSNREYTGEAAGDELGGAVAAGDIDGNGTPDMLFGALFNDDSGANAGAAYLVYTTTSALSADTVSISTAVEFTGEAAGDSAGSAVASGDLNGDGYDELLIGAPGNDSTAAAAGSAHVILGNASQYSGTAGVATTQVVEYDGEATTDSAGSALDAQDLNNDGYAELMIGAIGISPNTGASYIVAGAATLTGGNVGTVATVEYDGVNAGDNYGRWLTTGDLNGDGYVEFISSAVSYLSGDGTGAVYIGYLSIDADEDGVLGASGIFYTGSDCNDADATISAEQTYYPDADGDTLGDPAGTTASLCAATAPDGYVADASDTDDTIPDGTNLVSVTGATAGTITVTDSTGEHTYTIFTSSSSKATTVTQYEDTGYGIVLHRKGKKVYLVNLFTGEITDKVTIKKAGFVSAAMLMKDLRSNNKDEVVVTGKTKAKVTVAIVKVSSAAGTLTKSDSAQVTNKHVSVTKTKATSKKINLKNKKGKILFTLLVSKKYTLTLQ